MCDRRKTCYPPAPPLLSVSLTPIIHFPIPLVILRDADTVSLRLVCEERQQCPVWPVRVNQTVQELGSSSVSICRDSCRVLWKRLFHLAVDRFINNTAVHCRDLDSVSNRTLRPMIIIIHWLAYGSVLFSDVSETVKCEKTKSLKYITFPKFQSRQRAHLKPHTDHQANQSDF